MAKKQHTAEELLETILGVQLSIVGTLDKISTQLRYIERALRADAPNYIRPLAAYRVFDWSSIGAVIDATDADGVSRVEYGGHYYTRRSGSGKFGEAIWFSRPTGQSENGTTYARLITFKDYDDAEPVQANIASPPEQPTTPAPAAAASASNGQASDLMSFAYADGELVDRDNAAEVQAYTAYRRAHSEQPPTSKAALRQWYKLQNGKSRKQASRSQATA